MSLKHVQIRIKKLYKAFKVSNNIKIPINTNYDHKKENLS